MQWEDRYIKESAGKMSKETFFCGDGVMKVGPKMYPLEDDYRSHLQKVNPELANINPHFLRGGSIKFPNGHGVSIIWGSHAYGENYGKHDGVGFNEHPTRVEVAHIDPNGEFVDHRRRSVLENQTHQQVNDLIDQITSLPSEGEA